MKVGIMITNGGPHPADKWAMTTSGKLMDAVFGSGASVSSRARKFENKLIDILEAAHDGIQKDERSKLKSKGKDRLYDPLDPRKEALEATQKIVAAAAEIGEVEIEDRENPGQMKTVSLAKHFENPKVQQAVAGIVASDLASSIDIDRDHFAADHPNCPHCKGFRKARNEVGGLNAHSHIRSFMEDRPKA